MLKSLRLLFSNFTLFLLATVLLASLLPAHGEGAVLFDHLTTLAIVLLFFMHGAKLSRQAIIAGIMHWRLHALVFSCTFLLFPLIGFTTSPITEPLLGHELFVGLLFLCALPGTVQSAIAFTSIARGNIPAAVCSASASSILGIVITPLAFGLLMGASQGSGGSLLDAILRIGEELLLPFIVGHLSRPLIGAFVERHRKLLGSVDQGSILLIVYSAFSESVVAGLWRQTPITSLLLLTLVCCVLLAIVLMLTTWLARRLGFNKEDEITIVFCGSKKSLASGVPMAQVMFGSAASTIAIGPVLLPIMIFHQLQLMVCAVLAERYASR
jgi:sodium/bile acid cotransporter 7